MELGRPHGQELATVGDGPAHHVFTPASGPISALTISPSGREVADGGIVDLATGRERRVTLPHGFSRYSASWPGASGEWSAFEPSIINGPFGEIAWDGSRAIIASLTPLKSGRQYAAVLNLNTGRWSKPLYFESIPGQHGLASCLLSTGRVLVGIKDYPSHFYLPDTWRLYVTDPGYTSFTRLTPRR